MATPQSHGARLTRPEYRRNETGGRLTAVSKSPSIASNIPNPSRLPTHTAYQSPRPTTKRTDTGVSASSRETTKSTVSKLPRSINTPLSSSSSPANASGRVIASANREIGLGINTEAIRQPAASVNKGSRQSSLLRRKASSNDNHIQYARSEYITSSHERHPQKAKLETVSSPGGYTDLFPGSVLGISLPAISTSTSQLSNAKPRVSEQATSSSRMAHFMSRRLPHKTSTHELAPPNPTFAARSSSASTRCSESPGPFSRTSTPTSISSHSPGVVHAPKFVSRLKLPASPVLHRPPVTKRRLGGGLDQNVDGETQGLPMLRESVTSSSSSSTIRAVERMEDTESINTISAATNTPISTATTKNRRPAVPPAPSLRTSSRRLPKPRAIPNSSSRIAVLEESSSDPPADATAIYGLSQKPSIKSPSVDDHQRKAPLRPSRDGALSLDDAKGTSPIIQSNMNQILTSGHKRRESIEATAMAQTVGNPVFTVIKPVIARTLSSGSKPSKVLTKVSPPNLGTPKDSVPTIPKVTTARAPLRLQKNLPVEIQNPEPSPQIGSSVKPTKKFGLFSRPTKSSPEINSLSIISDRSKGPAAGTGHEGYGKYARRGRSGSISSNSSRGRSTSSTRPSSSRKSSFASQDDSELDDFYKDRLAPVIIGGGGHILDNRNSGTGFYRASGVEGSTESIDSGTSHTAIATNNIKGEFLSTNSDTNIRPRNRTRLPIGQRNGIYEPLTDDDSNLGELFDAPSLAARRSVHRSQLKEEEPRRVLPPINTNALTSSPSLDSRETFQSSIPTTNSTTSLTDDVSEGREGNWLKPKPKKHLDRIKLPSKWNFFQRAQHSPKKTALDDPKDFIQLAASVSRVSDFRSIAHYAILDGSEEDTPGTLDDKLREIEESLSLGKEDVSRFADSSKQHVPEQTQFEQDISRPNVRKPEQQVSMISTPPPNLAGDASTQWPPSQNGTFDHHGTGTQLRETLVTPAVKESRLPQVGRIPKVVSKRDRLHKPPPQSFSRPFFRTKASNTEPINPIAATNNAKSNERLISPVHAENPSSTEFTRFNFGQATTTPVLYESPLKDSSDTEFLAFPPRKGSEVSGSSSSDIRDFAATITANSSGPAAVLSEDEIWNEYDELLDDVVSPGMLPQFSAKYQALTDRAFNVYHTRHQRSSGAPKKESLVLGSNRSSESTISAPSPRLPLLPTSQQPPVSELPSLPNSETMPSTPLSFSDFFAGYGDRSSSIPSVIRQTSSSGSRYSSNSTMSKSGSRSSRGSNNEQRYMQLMDQKATSEHPQGNLRFSAVMTSRWLSFNRVLFSPAHEEIENNRQDRILVLDGLRNDDWSSYCALTYPDAIIYNLGSLGPAPARRRDSKLLTNHRQIHHAGFDHPFPFPKGFFAVVVFRFPIATSESAYYNAVSESKRVLRPGGYLEMSILDIDMVNMGNRARRSVRALKMRMQTAEPNISLSPASDIIQKMLGRRGFENLNRCMVGVPVAGCISDSRAGSFDDKDMSLNDMLKDASKQGDVPITKMVAKVGRWWWSRCYEVRCTDTPENEANKAEQAENSIWNDKALLKECEKRETGFKLLVCYAQKPLNPRRRTVSV